MGGETHICRLCSIGTRGRADNSVDPQFAELSDDLQLVGGKFAAALIDEKLVGDLLAFGEAAQTGSFERADVDENIIAAGFRLDKTKALLAVEPFHFACLHDLSLPGALLKGR